MRFTTDTDWTMITGAECYRCISKAYNQSMSITSKNGTSFKPEHIKGDMKYAGGTAIDTVCFENTDTCAGEYEFFVIRNQTDETRDALQRTDGVIGLAPDQKDNGPSFLTVLKEQKLVDRL